MKKVTVRISDEDRTRLELEYPELTRYELMEIATAAFEIASQGRVELSEDEIMNMDANSTYHAEFDDDGEDYESITIEISEVELTPIEILKEEMRSNGIRFNVASTGTIYVQTDSYSIRIADHDPNGKKNVEISLQKAIKNIKEFITNLSDAVENDELTTLENYIYRR